MRVATGLQQNAVLGSLLAIVVTVKRCHSGEAFVRLKAGGAPPPGRASVVLPSLSQASGSCLSRSLTPVCLPPSPHPAPQDPTGAIGGTLTRAVLHGEPDIRQGAVLRLRRVTVLRTPPPRSLNHLCITLDSVVQVVPPPDVQAGLQAATQELWPLPAPRLAFPALPAPPQAFSDGAAPRQQSPQQQQQQPAGTARSMQPPPARLPAAPAAASSLAWPSIGAADGIRLPRQQQQQQQQQPPRQATSSAFAWPSLGAPPGGRQEQPVGAPRPWLPPAARQPSQMGGAPGGAPPQQPRQGQQQQQPAASESVNFSIRFSQDQPWADDAHSGLPSQPSGQPAGRAGPAGGAAGSDWLRGLLAEAECDPFAATQASQPPPGKERPVLMTLQITAAPPSQPAPIGMPAPKRQCTTAGLALAVQPPQQQQPPLLGFADGIDELDLDE